MEAPQRPTFLNKATLCFLWTAMIVAFYTGAGLVTTFNISEERRWERDCRQLNITVCPQAPVCEWSTVKDRCESINGGAVLVSATTIGCLFLFLVLSAIMRSKNDGSERALYVAEAFSHGTMFAWMGIGLVAFGFSIAFADLIGIVVSLAVIMLGIFALYKAVCLVDERMTYRLPWQGEEGVGDEEEAGGDEEDESRSSSSSSGPGLIDQAVDLVRAGMGMEKPPLPSYDVVVGDMPGAPSVDSPIYNHFTGN